MDQNLRDAALEYHRHPPGKIAIVPTKPLTTQRDLSLAYSPGVAFACEAIKDDPAQAAELTARGNLVAVITNGTAVLGLGAIGALAAKPVMEGKSVLFKKFAGIDAIDLEIEERDPDKLVEIIAALEPSFGAINLEDIKAPECFAVEEALRKRMRIPVFHDDQHGTAIIVAAAMTNALFVTGRDIKDIKLVCSGAGAAALACLDLLVDLGLRRENLYVSDLAGVVYEGRIELMDPRKARYARKTEKRKLDEIIEGADVFLGLSAGGVLKPEMIQKMSARPIIFALANPTPEIEPQLARATRPDAVIATGRSDFPNQVNNALCYPYIFRGALDVGATGINETMKIAAAKAIAELARSEPSDIVSAAYADQPMRFGPDYLIPKPFDPRLIVEVGSAVAKAAMDSGVATRPIRDFNAYRESLGQFVFKSGLLMRPVFARAKSKPKRVVFVDGESRRVLSAVQYLSDEKIARPVLVGRRAVIEELIRDNRLRISVGADFDLVDPNANPHYEADVAYYLGKMQRRGVTPALARHELLTNPTVIAALMVQTGRADAIICGVNGQYRTHLKDICDVIGLSPGVRNPAALSGLILGHGAVFVTDTYVNVDPNVEDLAEATVLAADAVRRFGMEPKVALLSHSNFGSADDPSARKMRAVLKAVSHRAPEIEIEGEMHADAALSEPIRRRLFPNSRLSGAANLFVMPNLDAANISFNMLKILGDAVAIGPLLLGAARPAHIVTPSITVRGLINVAAIAVVDAQAAEGQGMGEMHD